MGHRRLHESPGLWTIYHVLDSDVADPFQAYRATRYVDTEIPHIPVYADGLEEGYATIATTNWLPYSWSINNVAFAEVMHTAFTYFQAGRPEEAYRLMKSSFLDGMYLGNSPGNLGQVSFYDAARGECYRDFGDPIGGSFPITGTRIIWHFTRCIEREDGDSSGISAGWSKASISLPDITYHFVRENDTDIYRIEQRFKAPLALTLQVNAGRERIHSVKVNGKKLTGALRKLLPVIRWLLFLLLLPKSSCRNCVGRKLSESGFASKYRRRL